MSVDNIPSNDGTARPGPVVRRVLSICAGLLALVCLILAVASLGRGGWSNERIILYAAEGGLISPRESLMHGVLFGGAMVIWIAVWVLTMAAPSLRARRIFRGAMVGVGTELALGVGTGVVCSDVTGMLVIGVVLALPMALVAMLARRWTRFTV